MERTCKKCGEIKSMNEFSKHKNFQGNDYICFSCKRKSINKSRHKYECKHRKHISDMSKDYQKKGRKKLSNWYIVDSISRATGLSQKIIWQYPELIKTKKIQMKLNRLIKK